MSNNNNELNNNLVKIAFIGNKKCGKRTLINKLLGLNILPTSRTKYSHTRIEIKQCDKLENQRYEIEYFSREEFSSFTSNQAYDRETRGHYNDILIGYNSTKSPLVSEQFSNYETLRDNLEELISSPASSIFVKSVTIWYYDNTNNNTFTFCDYPYLDSPNKLQIESLKRDIQDESFDLVVICRLVYDVLISDLESDIIKMIDSRRKLFVLTFSDKIDSQHEFNLMYKQHLNTLKEKLKIESNQVKSIGWLTNQENPQNSDLNELKKIISI